MLEAFEGDGYLSVRVEAGVRHYKHCHISLFGCIQPQVLQDVINGTKIRLDNMIEFPLSFKETTPTFAFNRKLALKRTTTTLETMRK